MLMKRMSTLNVRKVSNNKRLHRDTVTKGNFAEIAQQQLRNLAFISVRKPLKLVYF